MNTITVTVAGTCNSGKSTIGLLIAETLLKAGLKVEVEDLSGPEGWPAHQNARLAALSARGTSIMVKELQVSRRMNSKGEYITPWGMTAAETFRRRHCTDCLKSCECGKAPDGNHTEGCEHICDHVFQQYKNP